MKVRFVAFENRGGMPVAAYHDADMNAEGQLVHCIDGAQRAVVPPEGWDDYAAEWPGIQPVVDGARAVANAIAAAQANLTNPAP